MNINITRGLALAAVSGGFLFLGATAANAATSDDQPGTLDGITSYTPVDIAGLDLGVLDGRYLNDGTLLGDGILVNGGNLTSSPVITGDLLTENGLFAAAPVDASNTWLSVFGNRANGIVLVPNLVALPTADAEGADVDAPVNIWCSSITVLSTFAGDCDSNQGATSGTAGNSGTLTNDVPVDSDGLQVSVLDGVLGNETSGVLDHGILIDPTDDVTNVGAEPGIDNTLTTDIDAPIDASGFWVSILGNPAAGESSGVVIVPNSSVDASALTGGLVDSETTAPIAISCASITVLSNYQANCSDGTTPEEPTTPVTPVTPTTPTTGDVPTAPGNGGTDGDNAAPCVLEPASSITDSSDGTTTGLLAGAALLGGIGALALTALGRKLRTL